jgi:hypothetical protein
MTAQFKSITLEHGDERQVYVVEDRVTEEQLRNGDDDGVVCLMLDPSQTEKVVEWLNSQDGHV